MGHSQLILFMNLLHGLLFFHVQLFGADSESFARTESIEFTGNPQKHFFFFLVWYGKNSSYENR